MRFRDSQESIASIVSQILKHSLEQISQKQTVSKYLPLYSQREVLFLRGELECQDQIGQSQNATKVIEDLSLPNGNNFKVSHSQGKGQFIGIQQQNSIKGTGARDKSKGMGVEGFQEGRQGRGIEQGKREKGGKEERVKGEGAGKEKRYGKFGGGKVGKGEGSSKLVKVYENKEEEKELKLDAEIDLLRVEKEEEIKQMKRLQQQRQKHWKNVRRRQGFNFDYSGQIIDIKQNKKQNLISKTLNSQINIPNRKKTNPQTKTNKQIPIFIKTQKVPQQNSFKRRIKTQVIYRTSEVRSQNSQKLTFSNIENPIEQIDLLPGVKATFEQITIENPNPTRPQTSHPKMRSSTNPHPSHQNDKKNQQNPLKNEQNPQKNPKNPQKAPKIPQNSLFLPKNQFENPQNPQKKTKKIFCYSSTMTKHQKINQGSYLNKILGKTQRTQIHQGERETQERKDKGSFTQRDKKIETVRVMRQDLKQFLLVSPRCKGSLPVSKYMPEFYLQKKKSETMVSRRQHDCISNNSRINYSMNNASNNIEIHPKVRQRVKTIFTRKQFVKKFQESLRI